MLGIQKRDLLREVLRELGEFAFLPGGLAWAM